MPRPHTRTSASMRVCSRAVGGNTATLSLGTERGGPAFLGFGIHSYDTGAVLSSKAGVCAGGNAAIRPGGGDGVWGACRRPAQLWFPPERTRPASGQGRGSHALRGGRPSARALASCPQWAVEPVGLGLLCPKGLAHEGQKHQGWGQVWLLPNPLSPWPCPSMRPLSRPRAWEVAVDARGPGCESRFSERSPGGSSQEQGLTIKARSDGLLGPGQLVLLSPPASGQTGSVWPKEEIRGELWEPG